MIFPLTGLLIGAGAGAFGAKRRGGKVLDLLQWAAVVGMSGALIGLFILVFIERSAFAG